MKNKDFDNKDIKIQFPTLEDLMFKNKRATAASKKKKNFKKMQQFIKNKKENEQDLY